MILLGDGNGAYMQAVIGPKDDDDELIYNERKLVELMMIT